jgi:hypothetical protein
MSMARFGRASALRERYSDASSGASSSSTGSSSRVARSNSTWTMALARSRSTWRTLSRISSARSRSARDTAAPATARRAALARASTALVWAGTQAAEVRSPVTPVSSRLSATPGLDARGLARSLVELPPPQRCVGQSSERALGAQRGGEREDDLLGELIALPAGAKPGETPRDADVPLVRAVQYHRRELARARSIVGGPRGALEEQRGPRTRRADQQHRALELVASRLRAGEQRLEARHGLRGPVPRRERLRQEHQRRPRLGSMAGRDLAQQRLGAIDLAQLQVRLRQAPARVGRDVVVRARRERQELGDRIARIALMERAIRQRQRVAARRRSPRVGHHRRRREQPPHRRRQLVGLDLVEERRQRWRQRHQSRHPPRLDLRHGRLRLRSWSVQRLRRRRARRDDADRECEVPARGQDDRGSSIADGAKSQRQKVAVGVSHSGRR